MVCREHIFWQVLPQGAEGYAQKILAGHFLHRGQGAWLGVDNGMYDGFGDTVFPLDIQHDIASGCKEIDFALHNL